MVILVSAQDCTNPEGPWLTNMSKWRDVHIKYMFSDCTKVSKNILYHLHETMEWFHQKMYVSNQTLPILSIFSGIKIYNSDYCAEEPYMV